MARAVPTSSLPDETVGEALRFIAENLRPADRDELEASAGADIPTLIALSEKVSTKAWLILDRDDTPIAAFGVAPGFFSGVGIPWFVATPGIEREAHAVARHTRRYVAEMLEDFDVLTNHVDLRNDFAQDWLLWSGFEFIDVSPEYGVAGVPFIQFRKAAANV